MEYDLRHFKWVLRALPGLVAKLDRLGMRKWERLARYLEGVTLKSLDRDAEALQRFEWILPNSCGQDELELHGLTLVEMGACYGRRGDSKRALGFYQEALKVRGLCGNPLWTANLFACVGETHRTSGNLEAAMAWLQRSVDTYESAGISVQAAYLRLVLADILIEVGHPEMAVEEVVAALPTIEDKKLVPDGFMAIALLRESVKRRKADPNALRELREHLQKQN
ncbi:MAG: tetratricopeptide repeat protein [Thermoanaerobaculia bacterium]